MFPKSAVIEMDEDAGNNKDFKIFPNPSIDQVKITNSAKQKFSCTIFSLDKKLVLNQENLSKEEETVDISEISKGAYILMIKDEGGHKYQFKLVKK